ncbi:PaaI family thioesterase [Amycolatopsis acidicola]|uniref:PaaI family thioesterase n=1 Tax=Amycolatopsis acidicola TaxID=2596893 RepID=UPI00140E3E5D|nr:PaaI family thioesterase [Amycolatopsis acidicola]
MTTDSTSAISPLREWKRVDAVVGGPLSPAESLFGIRVTGGAPGRITGSCDLPGPEVTAAATPLGYVGALLDLSAGRSVRTTLDPGYGCRTASLRIDAAGEFPGPGQTVEARAETLETYNGTVLAGARLSTTDGRVIARCTGRFAVVAEQPQNPGTPVTSPETVLAGLLGQVAGAGDPREIRLELTPEVANQYGIMHGGVQAFLSGAVLRNLITAEGGADLTVLDLTVRYHRPVVVAGPPIALSSVVERRGRRLAVAGTTVVDAAGKPLFTARATFGAA